MSAYAPPIAALSFALTRVVGLTDLPDHGLGADDIDAILGEAGKFAGEVLAPINRGGDTHGAVLENGVTRTAPGFADAYHRFVEAGWHGLAGPPEFGGQGLPTALSTAVQELWCGANMAWSLCPILTQGGVDLLSRHGTESQKARYLPHLVNGDWTGSMILTEPQAGSDLSAIRTKAVRENGHYRLTGQKIFITFGDHDYTENIVHMVLARLPDAPPGIKGISVFAVPKFLVGEDGALGARNDVRPLSLEHKLGIHGSPTAVMAFGEQEGAYAELIGEENRGIEYMFIMMNAARLAIGVQGIGIAERAYQQALGYARNRVQGRPAGGTATAPLPILHHPDVRRMLLVSKARIAAARLIALEAAVSLDRSKAGDAAAEIRASLLIPIVKAWSTDLGVDVASTGVQVHGGMGFIEETGAAQHYRDARIAPIYEGTNGIQAADLVGRKVTRDGGAAMAVLLADIDTTLTKLGTIDHANARSLALQLVAGRDALARATDWLLVTAAAEPAAIAASAVSYLDLSGTVVGGWMLARAVIAGSEDIASGTGDRPTAESMLALAGVYAAHTLPRAPMLADLVATGAASVLEAGEEAL